MRYFSRGELDGELRFFQQSSRSSPCMFGRRLTHLAAVLTTSSVSMSSARVIDPVYPGTSVARMNAARERVSSLKPEALSGEWEEVRKSMCTGFQPARPSRC